MAYQIFEFSGGFWMKGFENLLSGEKKYLFFDGLSSLECQKIIFEAKKRGCVVERVGCWTSHDDYFCIHDYERFTVDYLVDIEEWETQAFNQLIQTYAKRLLKPSKI
jgi:hypothetical protein